MLADILGRNVVVPACPERACLGAAVFAAVAAGIFPDVAAAMRGMVRRDREFIPNRAAHAAYGVITQ
jgi:ribulose kinase